MARKYYHLKREIKYAFETPEPEKKEAFLNRHLKEVKLTDQEPHLWKFLFIQAAYIQKSTWLLLLVLFSCPFLFRSIVKLNSEIHIISGLTALVPFFICILMKEWLKPRQYQMAELELSCRHSFFSALMARFCILGSAEFLLLLAAAGLLGTNGTYGYIRLVLYFITPWLLSSLLSFYAIEKGNRENEAWLCLIVCAAISAGLFSAPVTLPSLYEAEYIPIWCSLMILLLFANGKKMAEMKSNMEVWLWN